MQNKGIASNLTGYFDQVSMTLLIAQPATVPVQPILFPQLGDASHRESHSPTLATCCDPSPAIAERLVDVVVVCGS